MMGKGWAEVPIGSVARPVQRLVEPVPGVIYRQIGVRLWGQGAYERESMDGGATKYKTLNRVEAGDIIVNKIWARNGSVGVVTNELAGCHGSGEFPTFAVDPERLLPRWFHWATRTRWFWHRCDLQSQGTSGKNRIRPEKFLAIHIPLPPLPEQRRIVAKIDRLAEKIEEARGLRELAGDGLVAISTVASSALIGRDEHVTCRSLRELGLAGKNPIQTGPFGAQLHKSEFALTGVPVLNVGNVWPDGLRLDRLDHVTSEKANSLARYSLCSDDLLFARSGATLGKVCIVPEKCHGWLMTGHLFRVRFDKKRCLPKYAFAALRHAEFVRDQVFFQVRGATRPGFNTTLLGNVRLPLPPIKDQHRIVAYLDDLQGKVDAIKKLQEQTAAELDALPPPILDRAFKGEL